MTNPSIDFFLPTRATVEECTGISRVAEDARDAVVLQVTPSDFHRTSGLANQSRKSQAMLAKVFRHPECRTHAPKRLEHGSDSLLNLLIRVQHDAAFVIVYETKR